jgi:hypothetical protein
VFTPPLSLTFVIISDAFIGMVVGALIELLASLVLRLKIRLRDIVTDGVLGALGFPLAFTVVMLIPWQNTITYRVGNTLVTSTMNHYQNPDLVAYSAAILLPILREIRRFKSMKSAGPPLRQSK